MYDENNNFSEYNPETPDIPTVDDIQPEPMPKTTPVPEMKAESSLESEPNIWDTPAKAVPNPQPFSEYTNPNVNYTEPTYTTPETEHGAYSPNFYKPGYNPNVYGAEPPKKKKNGKAKKFITKAVALVVAAAICAGCSGIAATIATDRRIKKAIANKEFTATNQVVLGSTTANTVETTGEEQEAMQKSRNTAAEIYDQACEQVVGIKITGTTSANFFGVSSQFAVSGSGFIISQDGYILTNYHVIEYGVKGYDVQVIMHDGTTYTASIVGYEEDNDVAVLKIDATGLNPVKIGTTANIVVGEDVYCVGNALGELAYSLSDGIVSATNRVISTDVSTDVNMFQVTAAVNHGNSGGPVYNDRGEVIGIVTAKYTANDAEGLGFAIPIDDAMSIATDLIENGYVTGKAYFGFTVRTVEQSVIDYYNLSPGAYVQSVVEGSAAENAGIQVGDIITAIGDKEIKSKDDILSAKRAYRAGDETTITVVRNGEEVVLNLIFDEEPQPQPQQTTDNSNNQQQQQYEYNGDWNDYIKNMFPNYNMG